MTHEGEDVRVPQQLSSPVPDLPRLFGDAEESAVGGAGGGGEGVGEADERDTGASPFHGGARPGDDHVAALDSDLEGLLDGSEAGVHGARPASRRELAELI